MTAPETTSTLSPPDLFLSGFGPEVFDTLPAGEAELLRRKRAEAFARYSEIPAPTVRDEEYRRLDPDKFRFGRYERLPALQPAATSTPGSWDEHFDLVISVDDEHYRIDDRNGICASKGVCVCSLADAANDPKLAALLDHHLQGDANCSEEPRKFSELNNAFWNVGFLVHVPAGVEIEKGILLRYQHRRADAALLPRLLVVAGKQSRFTMAESFESDGDAPFLCVSHREFYLDPAADVKLISLQEWGPGGVHIGEDWARVHRDAKVDLITLTLGGRVSKISVGCDVCERNANAYLGGLYFAADGQHFDQKTLQMHSAPDTYSNMMYKGAAKSEGYSVYQGIIRATHGSIGVDAYQTNNNLLLDDTARTDSLPGLIIDADELACSHGATMGNLDEELVYYLRSRGIPEVEARKLLVLGFFEEMVERVPYAPIRDRLHRDIETKLGFKA